MLILTFKGAKIRTLEIIYSNGFSLSALPVDRLVELLVIVEDNYDDYRKKKKKKLSQSNQLGFTKWSVVKNYVGNKFHNLQFSTKIVLSPSDSFVFMPYKNTPGLHSQLFWFLILKIKCCRNLLLKNVV